LLVQSAGRLVLMSYVTSHLARLTQPSIPPG